MVWYSIKNWFSDFDSMLCIAFLVQPLLVDLKCLSGVGLRRESEWQADGDKPLMLISKKIISEKLARLLAGFTGGSTCLELLTHGRRRRRKSLAVGEWNVLKHLWNEMAKQKQVYLKKMGRRNGKEEEGKEGRKRHRARTVCQKCVKKCYFSSCSLVGAHAEPKLSILAHYLSSFQIKILLFSNFSLE